MSRSRGKRKAWSPSSGKPEATAADPTRERLAKQPDGPDGQSAWERTGHSGGQASHRVKTVLELVRDQVQNAEWTAMSQFADLAEVALRVGDTICGRTYTGMPFANSAARDSGETAVKRAEARAEFDWLASWIFSVDEFFLTTAFALVLNSKNEATGRALSLEEFGANLMRWRDEPTRKGGALVAIRATARVIMRAQKEWEKAARGQRRERSMAKEAFEHGRKVERYEHTEVQLRKAKIRDQVETHFKLQRANGRVRA